MDRETLRARFQTLQASSPLILQASVSAGLTWLIIRNIAGSRSVVFSPIVAVITVAVAQTQRLRRALELILGVGLGVLLGDLLVAVIGTGSWQVAFVVALGMAAAIMVGGGPVLVIQTAATVIIIAAIRPPRLDEYFYLVRAVDAVIGGCIGLAVSSLLLPVNPLVIARRTVPTVLSELAETLGDLAEALRSRNHRAVREAAERTRRMEQPLGAFLRAMEVATETARMAPLRRRSLEHLEPFVDIGDRMDHVIRNLRVLSRRARTLLSQDEQVPPGMAEALDRLASGVRALLDDLLRGAEPELAREEVLRACRLTADVPPGMSISAQVIVGQLRSTAVDLLRASGLHYTEADQAIRRAVTEPRLRRGPALLPARPPRARSGAG